MKLRKTLVALGAAATLTLTACGNATDSASGGDSTDDSVSGSASSALTEDNFASSVSDAQSEAHSTHMEFSMDVMGQQITGSGDIAMPKSEDPKDAEMSMTMDIPTLGEMEMRLVDAIAYIKMGSMTQDKFVKIDSTGDNPLGQSLDKMTGQTDPNAMITQLAGSLKDFEKTDDTLEIDGVEATKYKLTIDGSKAQSMMSSPGMSGSTAQLPDEVTAYVWIGEDDLMRKMTMELKTGSTPVSMEMTFTDWGEPVEVEAPPESEITDSSMFDSMNSM